MKRLRKVLLATASSVALMAVAANAADMGYPVKAPPQSVVAERWSGPYIGVNAGAAWNRARFFDQGLDGFVGVPFAFPAGEFWSPNEAGFTGGGQIGYNWQAGSFVYGLEADLNWANSKTSALFLATPNAGDVTASTKLDWFSTVRGRLGVTFSPVLLYVTGGLAIGHFSDSWGQTAAPTIFASDTVRLGWTVGAGLEYMFAQNWTVKVEGLYADFGATDIVGFPPGTPGFGYRSRFEHTTTVVRAGLNWKW